MVGIAQLVEQRTENPRVTSSNLVPGTGLIFMSVFSTNYLILNRIYLIKIDIYSLIVFIHTFIRLGL